MGQAFPAFLVVAASSGLLAQGSVTTPSGFLTLEGNYAVGLFEHPSARLQQADATFAGAPPMVVRSIALRRDSNPSHPAVVGRTVDVEIMLGAGVAYPDVSTTFANNHAAPPTIAFAQRPITLPAWPAPPVGSPQPWSIVLQLDAPWVHVGTRPLLFDVRTANASWTGTELRYVDFAAPSSTGGTVPALDRGCAVQPRNLPMLCVASWRSSATNVTSGSTSCSVPPTRRSSRCSG